MKASGSCVHVVADNGSVTRYWRSDNEGATYSPPITLGQGLPNLDKPIASDGDTVVVVMCNDDQNITDFAGRRSVGDLTFVKSTDKGLTWSGPVTITSGAKALRHSLAIDGNVYVLAWMDYRNNRWDIYFKRSVDGGATWSADTQLVESVDNGTGFTGANRPSIAIERRNVHVTWFDGSAGNPRTAIEGGTVLPQSTEVYYKKSSDSGATFGPAVQLTKGATVYSGRPNIAAMSDGTVLLSFDSRTDGADNEIALLRSADRGVTWGSKTFLTASAGVSTHSVFAVGAGRLVAVAWMDNKGGASNAYRRVSTDSGASFGGEELISDTPCGIPFASYTNNYMIAFTSRLSDYQMTTRRYPVNA